MKIWYISRTYLPEKTGGALIRIAQVDFFRSQGAEVVVVAPDYLGQDATISGKEIRLPYRKSRIRLNQVFERIGLYEDYLDRWVDDSLALLKDRVRKEDYVFATSGGELGCIKLGSKLKDLVGCKFVVNLHYQPACKSLSLQMPVYVYHRLLDDVRRPVVGHHVMLALLETGDHVHAHLAEPDESEFHVDSFLALLPRCSKTRADYRPTLPAKQKVDPAGPVS